MADTRNTATVAKRDSMEDHLAENLGKLNLSLEGAPDQVTTTTNTTTTETADQTQDTWRSRYNLRSRNKDTSTAKTEHTQPVDSKSGTNQGTIRKYLPPHQRAKDSRKDISQEKVTTEDQPSTRPRTRRPRSRKTKSTSRVRPTLAGSLRCIAISRNTV